MARYKEDIKYIETVIAEQAYIIPALMPLIKSHLFGIPIEEWIAPSLAGGTSLAGLTFVYLKNNGDRLIRKFRKKRK